MAKRKTAPKRATKKKVAASARSTKTDTVIEMLRRPGGATAAELLKVTGWQPHSLRGFISGTVGKRLGLAVTSTKGEEGRSYSVAKQESPSSQTTAPVRRGGRLVLVAP